ncbi:MAG: DUF3575 domain-containing protein [Bacteroidetes bacterium]|uniref:DUF3575 domain-containing protein n=1 Tax=Candidatus Egerieousia excrementavium TaxID=2840778 RepID=A0A9D9GWF2_9BACT|nr:DUF3575 domain-containing protein [Candidatus Egerieousia excrementavium]
MNRRLLLLVFCLLVAPLLHAGETAVDSVRIYYRLGYRYVDTSLRDNGEVLKNLCAKIEKALQEDLLEKVVIYSYTSPDGTHKANLTLAARRMDSLESWLLRNTPLPATMLETNSGGIAWGLLRDAVSKSEMQYKKEVLQILDNTPVWVFDSNGKVIGSRKKELMDLKGGVPYRYMYEHLFPDLRSSIAIMLYIRTSGPQTEEEREPAASEKTSPAAPEKDMDATVPEESVPPATEKSEAVAPDEKTTAAVPEQERYEPLHKLALKTNIIYDLALMPSLEVEYMINERWSVNAEGEVAWWKNNGKHKYYQIATLSPEVRYWFKTKKRWHGHYVGLFGGGSWYDLENGKRGYKGEFWKAGLSYGYMFPIGRSLSFETGIGLGFLRTWYEEYLPIDGHYVYQQSSRTNWIGPVKLKFTLVWRLWDENRSGKGGKR